MIEESLAWAGVERPTNMLDVGCGIGGSSRHIARKYGCRSTGITLSPVQAARAGEISARAGLGDRVSFRVADALAQPFEDGAFDFIWSMESGEHMPNKRRVRAAGPGFSGAGKGEEGGAARPPPPPLASLTPSLPPPPPLSRAPPRPPAPQQVRGRAGAGVRPRRPHPHSHVVPPGAWPGGDGAPPRRAGAAGPHLRGLLPPRLVLHRGL